MTKKSMFSQKSIKFQKGPGMSRIVPILVSMAPALCMAEEGAADRLVTAAGKLFLVLLAIVAFYAALNLLGKFLELVDALWKRLSVAGKIIFFGVPVLAVYSFFIYIDVFYILNGDYVQKWTAVAFAPIIVLVAVFAAIFPSLRRRQYRIEMERFEKMKRDLMKKGKKKKEKKEPSKIYKFLFKDEDSK